MGFKLNFFGDMMKINFNDINKFHMLSVDFKTENNDARIYLSSDNEINIDMNGIHTYLCDKQEFNDFVEFKNKRIYINDVECVIRGIDWETIDEFNDWCNRLEEEWMD